MLITGGSGFIGSHLAESLLDRKASLVIVGGFSNSTREWVNSKILLANVNLTNPESVDDVVTEEFGFVSHLTARKNPNDDYMRGHFKENTTMTHLLPGAVSNHRSERLRVRALLNCVQRSTTADSRDYAPLESNSVYETSKLGDEGVGNDVRLLTREMTS